MDGETSPNLSMTSVTPGDGGSYYVIVGFTDPALVDVQTQSNSVTLIIETSPVAF